MALESKQNFLKGINRRFSREDSSNPDFFYTLQNARLFNRGDTGKVRRINGYSDFVATGTTYSNILDIIEFNELFVVLYEDAVSPGTFYVEGFDSDGTQQFIHNYTDTTSSVGALTESDDTIFIAPHNKIIYDNDGTFELEDFVSKVPTISGSSQSDATKASASINVTGGVDLTGTGTKAYAFLTVKRNNTVLGSPDTFQVELDTDGGTFTTGDITVNYKDTEGDIATKIISALKAESNIDGLYEILSGPYRTDSNLNSSPTVLLRAKSAGPTRNNDSISLIGSEYNIVDDDEDDGPDVRLVETGTPQSISDQPTPPTVRIRQPKGGSNDGGNVVGPLYIRITPINHTVKTENLIASDTDTDIENKINTALNNDPVFTKHYSSAINTGTIDLTALETGTKFNGKIDLKVFNPEPIEATEVFAHSKSDFSGGIEVEENLTLEPYTDYWYKARYKYIDGHVSEDCFPIKLNTGASKSNTITFDTDEEDLDGSRPKLQIFRKKEGGPFFLIDEDQISGTTYQKLDDGIPEKGVFEGPNLVWTKQHKAQTIVDQRYVRANIEYNTEQYTDVADDGTDFTVGTETASGDESLPNNTRARFFIQPQYSDGTKGYFQQIDSLDIDTTGDIPNVEQNTPLENADKDIEEVGIFVNYKPHAPEYIYKFNSIEIANPNVPTIEDSAFYPSRTRVFFGFKFLEVWESAEYNGIFKVAGWDSAGQEKEHGGFFFSKFDDSGPISPESKFPQEISSNVHGLDFTYVRHGFRDAGNEGQTAVYKLANFEGIKKAVSTGELKVRLVSSNIGNLSKTVPDKDLFDQEVKVTSLIDKSSKYADLDIYTKDADVLVGPYDSRIYIELEESVLDEIDNQNLTSYGFKRDYESQELPDVFDGKFEGLPKESIDLNSYTMTWEFTNLKETNSPSFNAYTGDEADNDGGRPEAGAFGLTYYRYDWDYTKFELTNITFLDDEDTLIFIGRKENQTNVGSPVSFDVTGMEFIDDPELKFVKLQPSNIYSRLFTKSELNINKTTYSNQLIWSSPLRNSAGFTGGRTFSVENFFNIGNENGEIVEVESLGNKMYVFCERGVALVNVGQVLTQQKEGEVFVNSEEFMTNYYWITDNITNIQRGSIKKYQNQIFFSDGYDVYKLGQKGLQNISNGLIELDPDRDYYGLIDSKHKEYQLCDYANTETWVFNIEFEQWYGPFTYKFKAAEYLNNKLVMVDDSLYEHDTSNTFDGTTYTTLIESVANDTDQSFYDKTFRKFYINHSEDGDFYYGKDFNSLVGPLAFSSMKSKSGHKQQGVKPSENNGKNLYWEISTTTDGFELKDIVWRFKPKRRR